MGHAHSRASVNLLSATVRRVLPQAMPLPTSRRRWKKFHIDETSLN